MNQINFDFDCLQFFNFIDESVIGSRNLPARPDSVTVKQEPIEGNFSFENGLTFVLIAHYAEIHWELSQTAKCISS